MNTKEIIAKQLAENPIILYMKGIPSAPECGFSAKAVAILNDSQVPFAYVDVLKAPFIRDKLPSVSRWPTYPQLFINGELIGGADIVEAMQQDGTLLPLLQTAVRVTPESEQATTISHGEVHSLIELAYPDAQVFIEGEGCNLAVTVISSQFVELSLVKQHQGVMASLNEVLANGRLHAVTLKTFTPEQWQAQYPAGGTGLLQIQS